MNEAVTEAGSAGALRVTHCVGFYFPEKIGGTEVYVRDLATALSGFSVHSTVIAATDRNAEEYVWAQTPVVRYPTNWADLRGYSANAGRAGLTMFQQRVVDDAPDVFHLHSWTGGAGLRHLEQVAQLGIPCVVTMHVPSALCLRGTMLLNGDRACDGRIRGQRCTQCWAISRGLPGPLAFGVSLLPPINYMGGSLSSVWHRGATMLSGRALAAEQAHDLREMARHSVRIVAPSRWVAMALLANGIDERKIVVSPQAVAEDLAARGARRTPPPPSRELRVGFIGRIESYKGVHVLLDAMKRLPRDVPIRLLVAGSGTEPGYLAEVAEKGRSDARVEFLGSITHDQVPAFLQRLDVLAVPSNYMETGPLVVLEGFAFGLPVMGADLGGISERIRDGVDGWLLPFNDSSAWARAMQAAALDRSEIARRVANVAVRRTMKDVAREMTNLYREIAQPLISPAG
ncbi:MAG: glycosyltransferase [Enhydrobacter sp.]|nr:MAG: glycosyltransferase [Enhydrobacter sp.]